MWFEVRIIMRGRWDLMLLGGSCLCPRQVVCSITRFSIYIVFCSAYTIPSHSMKFVAMFAAVSKKQILASTRQLRVYSNANGFFFTKMYNISKVAVPFKE